jgi:hypothetical protein
LLETMGLPKTYAVKKDTISLNFPIWYINSMFRRAIHIANPIIHQLMLDLPKRTKWDPPRDQRSKSSIIPLHLSVSKPSHNGSQEPWMNQRWIQ